jgi:predicted 3-demethylubiquinone-9 3-methyltransferase (glyoxalase superfamily)
MFTGEQAGRAEEAMAHYTAVFPEAAIQGVHRYDGSGADAEGTVMHAQFTLCGETFMAMDSALEHGFGFSTANSHLVLCRDQAEIDHYWRALSAVPEAEQCGWLADRYGVSWQVAPARMIEMMTDPDPARVARVTDAFMAMKKLDLATLERAYAA